MSCTHACALSWHLQLMSLASPAESGTTIILERLYISPTEAIRQGDRPYMQQSGYTQDRVMACEIKTKPRLLRVRLLGWILCYKHSCCILSLE
jgi:hypothetical protein